MSNADTTLERLAGWFGQSHRQQISAVLAEYRISCPTRESGCVEDLAWAVHVAKRHISASPEEARWASRLLARIGVTSVADLRCPEPRCAL
ncbi:hypothetical protein AB0I28_21420 [Phytomonospora sp. NPDC050363]|uniref:hypothetical protein n=1 Tax=Phytomonospora sp. NPDC050363 TaxID=3155642 RepID=UPI00340EE218